MSREDLSRLLTDAARQVALEDKETFKIVIVEHGRAAGILSNLLIRSKNIPKKHITQLGYTASDEQNLAILQKRNPIVIVPVNIYANRPYLFYPPLGSKNVSIIEATGERVRVSHNPCNDEPFQLQTE